MSYSQALRFPEVQLTVATASIPPFWETKSLMNCSFSLICAALSSPGLQFESKVETSITHLMP